MVDMDKLPSRERSWLPKQGVVDDLSRRGALFAYILLNQVCEVDDSALASGITFLILITNYHNNNNKGQDQPPPTTPLRLKLLMDLPYLLLDIHPLHPLQILALFQLPIIARRRLLPPRRLLLADDRLARYPVKDIAALGRQAFEIGGYVRGGEVGGGLAEVGFGALFFPAGIKEFDCNS
jgi:hypothetical protein